MTDRLDIDHLKSWIGRTEAAEERLTIDIARRFHASLDLPGEPSVIGEAAPRLIHFCLCQPVVPTAALGPDGHPARGGFLPPVPLPRRMWAASEIRFMGDIQVGDVVRRTSTIDDVVVKEGRSGTLCFVTVTHGIAANAVPIAEDVQTIVYRDNDTGPPRLPPAPAAPEGESVTTVMANPTMLFRYSALTFNGHRIHYDRPYATEVEGYPGLVIHGPLQATLLLQAAIREGGGLPPARFAFRSVSTVFDTDLLCLHAGAADNGTMKLWTARPNGPLAMQAEATWP